MQTYPMPSRLADRSFRRFGICLTVLTLLPLAPAHGDPVVEQRVVIDLSGGTAGRDFRPDEALGAAIDGSEQGDIDRLLTSRNVRAMKSLGLRPLSYRLRTELGVQAWHWNPVGTWSDPARQQGYWTSSDELGAPIALSWGYRLPRRGDTLDNANNDDYSRLTDGDSETFWKSNPYLDPKVLRDGEEHRQWLVVRFDKPRPVDSAVIDWGRPFALRYAVQYWTGDTEYDPKGRWVTFPHGAVDKGSGGQVRLTLADHPVTTSHVRVLLLAASGTAPAGSTDWRDGMGYAVREVSFGVGRADGTLDDAVVHAASHDHQTFTHVSSTDPWHRAVDRNPNLEQAGIDRIFASGLGFGLPIMMPTGLLFDTPENVAAELRYIARRGYPVKQVELGEEPDGQYGAAEDYGALYLAMTDQVKNILPGARFGGPSLQSAFTENWMQPEKPGSWNGEFIAYLKRRHRLDDLGFLSFEYYPFDDICGDIHAKLIQQSAMMQEIARNLDRDGVPPATPRIITEYGFSAYSGRAMSEMPSALLMAGIVGQWLNLGGHAAYMFGYGPNVPVNQHLPCAGYGNMMPFLADANGQATLPMPSYHVGRLLTRVWTVPGHAPHRMIDARVEGSDEADVVAYAVLRPDHKLAVLLINRSATRTHRLLLAGRDARGSVTDIQGPAELYSYGPDQYAWHDAGEQSRPSRDEPPIRRHQPKGTARIELPPATLAVYVAKAASGR
ncbi:MAG TPA: discoidin domain-containing protein [Novosphingobium sp.]